MLSPSVLPVLLVLLLIDVSVVLSIVMVGGTGGANTSVIVLSPKVTSCDCIIELASKVVVLFNKTISAGL